MSVANAVRKKPNANASTNGKYSPLIGVDFFRGDRSLKHGLGPVTLTAVDSANAITGWADAYFGQGDRLLLALAEGGFANNAPPTVAIGTVHYYFLKEGWRPTRLLYVCGYGR
jgi:hypothetical protein